MRILPPETMEAPWSPRNNPSTQCASFTDAFLQDLSIWRLPKGSNQVTFIEQILWYSLEFYWLHSKMASHYPTLPLDNPCHLFWFWITCRLFQRKMPHCKPPFLCLWALRNAFKKIGPAGVGFSGCHGVNEVLVPTTIGSLPDHFFRMMLTTNGCFQK